MNMRSNPKRRHFLALLASVLLCPSILFAEEPAPELKGKLYFKNSRANDQIDARFGLTREASKLLTGFFRIDPAAKISERLNPELWIPSGLSPDETMIVQRKATRGNDTQFILWLASLDDSKPPIKLVDEGFIGLWAPDGKSLIVGKVLPNRLYITGEFFHYKLEGGELTKLNIPKGEYVTQWHKDKLVLLKCEETSLIATVLTRNLDGSDMKVLANDVSQRGVQALISPDGKKLAFRRAGINDDRRETIVVVKDLESGKETEVYGLLPTDNPGSFWWSPDSLWLAISVFQPLDRDPAKSAENHPGKTFEFVTPDGKHRRNLELPFYRASIVDWRY